MANSTLGVNSPKESKDRLRSAGRIFDFEGENEQGREDSIPYSDTGFFQKVRENLPTETIKKGMSATGSIVMGVARELPGAVSELWTEATQTQKEQAPDDVETYDEKNKTAETAIFQKKGYENLAAQRAKAGKTADQKEQEYLEKVAKAYGVKNLNFGNNLKDQNTGELRIDVKIGYEEAISEQERAAARANSPVLVSPSKKGSGPGISYEARKGQESKHTAQNLTG